MRWCLLVGKTRLVAGSLLIVTGPPGSGKSTVARLLADRLDRSALIEGDAFFAFLAAGAIEPWLPESHEQNAVVTGAAAMTTAEFVRGGYDVVYDGVMGPWFLDEFADAMQLSRSTTSSCCRRRGRPCGGLPLVPEIERRRVTGSLQVDIAARGWAAMTVLVDRPRRR